MVDGFAGQIVGRVEAETVHSKVLKPHAARVSHHPEHFRLRARHSKFKFTQEKEQYKKEK